MPGESLSGAVDSFSVLTGNAESFTARRVVLGYGVVDQMPEVPGFAEVWGRPSRANPSPNWPSARQSGST
ncbi:thioredoxin reductase [Sphingomonas zeicaulis]